MRGILSIFVLLMVYASSAQPPNISEVRKLYFDGWRGECGAVGLNKLLDGNDLSIHPVLLAYHGAAKTTLANCKKFPTAKLSIFFEGKNLLEQAVEIENDNAEIRFLRFTIQTNIPAILNYDDRKSDKKFLIDAVTINQNNMVDVEISKRIVNYLLEYGELNSEEKTILKPFVTINK